MRHRSSSRGHNTSASVTVTVMIWRVKWANHTNRRPTNFAKNSPERLAASSYNASQFASVTCYYLVSISCFHCVIALMCFRFSYLFRFRHKCIVVLLWQRPRPTRLAPITAGVSDELIVTESLSDCPFDHVDVTHWDCNAHDLSRTDAFLIPTALIKTDPRSVRRLIGFCFVQIQQILVILLI